MPLMMNCRTGSSASHQSAAETRAAEKNKEESAKYHDAIKAHDKDQTRETRKRMKELKKKFCKKCFSPLENSKVRIKSGIKSIECKTCGDINRWKMKD